MAIFLCNPFQNEIVMEQKQNEVYAAITLALHEYQGYTMHVPESGILTLGNADTCLLYTSPSPRD